METQNEIEILKEEVEKLSKTINELKTQKSENIKKTVEEYIPKDLISEIKALKEKIAQKIPVEKVDELKEKFEEKLPVIKKESEQIIENVSDFTKKNPVVSLGIAFGIGLLIGKVLKK